MKCTLRKEVKNEIDKYIDNEFINEMIKEIVLYIKTINKVTIDDVNYDKYDIDSKVILKDNGPFNVYDYMYVKDFIYELSWDGSYVEELEEAEDIKGISPVFKYEPRDIASVLYDKVQSNMEYRRGGLYKSFKKRYTEEFLFNSVRWFERTRDGKVYFDINPKDLSDDKKRSLQEVIKTEVGNAFKSRWGSPVATKVSTLDEKLLLDIYDKGCELLSIENKYSTEVVLEEKSIDEENIINLMIENIVEATKSAKGVNRLKTKVINSIVERSHHLRGGRFLGNTN